MRLHRGLDEDGDPRWFRDDPDGPRAYAVGVALVELMQPGALEQLPTESTPSLETLAPVDPFTEVWAAGVTYARSLQARVEESGTPDVYDRVYTAARPELFFKSIGWRVSGPDRPISVRSDSEWNVPEPELAAVLTPSGEIFGWTICNDVSSRSIEAANPLYLPQAKVYLGGCALGPAIVTADEVPDPYALAITLSIERGGVSCWSGVTSTSQLRRTVVELAEALMCADIFPVGVLLATGTSLVPDGDFTLLHGDVVRIGIDGLGELTNPTVRGAVPDAATRVARLKEAQR